MRGEIVFEIPQHSRLPDWVRLDIAWCGPQPLGHHIKLVVEDLAGIASRPSQQPVPLLLLGLERREQRL